MAIVVRPAISTLQRVADEHLGLRVHARRRLVQHQDPRVEGQRPRERQQLLLADRERRAPLRDRALVAVAAAAR